MSVVASVFSERERELARRRTEPEGPQLPQRMDVETSVNAAMDVDLGAETGGAKTRSFTSKKAHLTRLIDKQTERDSASRWAKLRSRLSTAPLPLLPQMEVNDEGETVAVKYAPVDLSFEKDWLWPYLKADVRFLTEDGARKDGAFSEEEVKALEFMRDEVLIDTADRPGFNILGRPYAFTTFMNKGPIQFAYAWWYHQYKNCVEYAKQLVEGYVDCADRSTLWMKQWPQGCRPVPSMGTIVTQPDDGYSVKTIEKKGELVVVHEQLQSERTQEVLHTMLGNVTAATFPEELPEEEWDTPGQGGAPDHLMGFEGLLKLIQNKYIPFEVFMMQCKAKDQFPNARQEDGVFAQTTSTFTNMARQSGHAMIGLMFKHKIVRTEYDDDTVGMKYAICKERWGVILGGNPEGGTPQAVVEQTDHALSNLIAKQIRGRDGNRLPEVLESQLENFYLAQVQKYQEDFKESRGHQRIGVKLNDHVDAYKDPKQVIQIKAQTFYHPDWPATYDLRSNILKQLEEIVAAPEIPIDLRLALRHKDDTSAVFPHLPGLDKIGLVVDDDGAYEWEVSQAAETQRKWAEDWDINMADGKEDLRAFLDVSDYIGRKYGEYVERMEQGRRAPAFTKSEYPDLFAAAAAAAAEREANEDARQDSGAADPELEAEMLEWLEAEHERDGGIVSDDEPEPEPEPEAEAEPEPEAVAPTRADRARAARELAFAFSTIKPGRALVRQYERVIKFWRRLGGTPQARAEGLRVALTDAAARDQARAVGPNLAE